MPPFGKTPSSRNSGLRKYTVSGVPSFMASAELPEPRSHRPMCSSSYTIVPPRGVTCAKPLGNTDPNRHTLAGKAVLMCECRVLGILAIRGPLVAKGSGASHLQLSAVIGVEPPHPVFAIGDRAVSGRVVRAATGRQADDRMVYMRRVEERRRIAVL